MAFPPTLWPTDKTRCPYCVQDGAFKVMTTSEGGDWFKCDRCGHIAIPRNTLFECPCLKCYELRPPDPKQVRPRPRS